MALTKVSGDFIKAGSITQGHLHTNHGITTTHIAEGDKLFFTNARVDARVQGNLSTSDLSEGTNLYYTDARVASYLTTNSYATQSYVNTQVSNLVDSAPTTLDTLNELAAALGDDANFSTTVTNSIATKMPLAGGTFTGDVLFQGGEEAIKIIGSSNQSMLIGSTGTGFAGIYMDASNGDFAGSDYVFIGQDDDKTFRLEAYSSAGDILFRESSTNTLRLSNGNATFSGTITASGYNDSNWNTAYGWGNHASAGYLASSSYTAADVLAKILTVDGPGSGLNADLLDGIGGDGYLRSNATDTASGALTFTNADNYHNGHIYYTAYSAAGQHYRHFKDGSNGSGVSINWRLFTGNAYSSTTHIWDTTKARFVTRIESSVDMRAPVFYDINNTAYYAHLDDTGTSIRAAGTVHASLSNMSAYQLNGTYVMDSSRNLVNIANITASGVAGDGTPLLTLTGSASATFNWISKSLHANLTAGETNLHLFGKAASTKNSGYIGYTWAGDGSNNNYVGIGQYSANHLFRVYGDQVLSTVTLRSDVDIQAPIFYDKNNTTYFINPGSNNSIKTVGDWRSDSSTWSGEFAGKMQYHSNWWYIQTTNGIFLRNASGSNNIELTAGGTGIANSDWRAPIFYDSNDTAYYVDPNGTSNILKIQSSSKQAGPRWDTAFYVLQAQHWYGDSSSQDMYIGESGNAVFLRGNLRTPIVYDYNNTGYYNDPASTSNVNVVQANRVITSEINNTDVWEGDITINGSSNTYYPVGWYGGEQTQVVEIEVFRNYAETAPNDWNTSTHKGSLVCKIRTNFGGWGGASYDWVLEEFRELYSTQLAWVGHLANSRGFALKLRGGGALYHVRIKGRSVAPTVTLGTWDPGNNSSGISSTTSVDSTLLGRRNHIRDNYLYSYNSPVLHEGSTAQTKSGTLQSNTDLRAPIFYDSNNTGYYTNPDGTSNMYRVVSNFYNTTGTSSPSYPDGGIEVYTSSNGVPAISFHRGGYSATTLYEYDGELYINPWTTRAQDGKILSSGNWSSYVFNGSWNGSNFPGSRWGGFSVNGGEIVFQRDNPSNGKMSVMVDGNFYAGENGGFWSVYSGNNYNNKVGIYCDSSGNLQIGTSSSENVLRTNYGYIQVGPMNSSHAHLYTDRSNFYFNKQIQLLGGSLINQNDIRAGIFYDVNDTNYFANLNGTATSIKTAGHIMADYFVGTQYGSEGYTIYKGYDNWNHFIAIRGYTRPGYGKAQSSTVGGHQTSFVEYAEQNASTGWFFISSQASTYSEVARITKDHAAFSGSARAPLFYDSNNTTYYVNPASATNLNGNTRIHNTRFGVSTSGTFNFSTGYGFHTIEQGNSNEPTLVLYNQVNTTAVQAYGLNVIHAAAHNNTTSRFFAGQGGSTERIKIYSNGNIQNSNNSYGQLSDINVKENVVDATPKLDEINQVRIVNFNYIGDVDEETGIPNKQIGVVAQELEQIFPGMVYECGDTETPTKSVKYSVFVPMLIKAIQELKTDNDSLRARIETLENQ